MSDPRDEMRRLSRRSFLWAGASTLAAYGVGRWLFTRPTVGGALLPLRRGFETNERVWSSLYSSDRLSPTYPESKVQPERVNGLEGITDDFDPMGWTLKVENVFGTSSPIELGLADVQALPHVEMVTELFCIEGWSIVQKWMGARFLDFAERYPPMDREQERPDVRRRPQDLVRYVSMATPDEGYFVGLDMASALHPQTLLCWEQNGQPLSLEHGAPLRLVIPTKYGIKNIKRIGRITYTDARPVDFWAEQGYDWYAGL